MAFLYLSHAFVKQVSNVPQHIFVISTVRIWTSPLTELPMLRSVSLSGSLILFRTRLVHYVNNGIRNRKYLADY